MMTNQTKINIGMTLVVVAAIMLVTKNIIITFGALVFILSAFLFDSIINKR